MALKPGERYCDCATKDDCYDGSVHWNLICKFREMIAKRLDNWNQNQKPLETNSKSDSTDS